MSKGFVKQHWKECVTGTAAVLEVLMLFYFNIFHLRDALDHDFAMVMRHVMEMADRHTLFLPYWNYMSQGEMDESSLIALPVYMLTGNIYLGYAIAGIVNILLWAWVIWRLLAIADISFEYRFLAMCLIFTIYDLGMLEYTNMLFFAGAYYVYKVLTPLMMLILMLTDWSGGYRIPDIILAVIYTILILFIGIASGTYVLLCGILPVLMCFILPLMLGIAPEKHRQWAVVTAGTVAVSLIGLAIGLHGGIEAYTYTVSSLDEVMDNLPVAVQDVLVLLRALTPYSERITSITGIMGLIRLAIAGVILIFGLYSLINVFGIQLYRRVRDTVGEALPGGWYKRELIHSGLISISLWTFVILALTISQPRYHIIGIIPLMICAVMNFAALMEKDKITGIPGWLLTAISFILMLVCLFDGFKAETEYFHMQDKNLRTIDQVLALMDEYKVSTAFNIDDTDMAAKLRFSDTSRVFETFVPEDRSVNNHIFYYTEWDRSAYADRNILLAKEGEFESCPDYIQACYEEIGVAEDYTVYLSETNPIDGMAGLPLNDMSVDLPVAPGYEYKGSIDENGYLHTEASGDILRSPVLNSPLDPVFTRNDGRSYRMTCRYGGKAGAHLDLYLDGELIQSVELPAGGSEVSYDLPPDPGEYTYVIRKEDTAPFVYMETVFEAVEKTL